MTLKKTLLYPFKRIIEKIEYSRKCLSEMEQWERYLRQLKNNLLVNNQININNEIIKRRDIALCKKYTELTIDKGISIDEAFKLITEDIFFISKDKAIDIINNHLNPKE